MDLFEYQARDMFAAHSVPVADMQPVDRWVLAQCAEVVRDVTAASGIATARTYQAAWADYDGDGDLDLLSGGKLYQNQSAGGSWLRVKLEGPGSAIGAVARVRVGERTLTRQVESSTGEGNQNEMVLHFGLGDYDGFVSLEVAWPGGARTTHNLRSGCSVSVSQQ